MSEKTIYLNFFQLCPITEEEEDRKEQEKNLKSLFTNLPTSFIPIPRIDSSVSIYGDIVKSDGLFLGTLVNNQTSDIPPGFDETTGELEALKLELTQGLGYATSFVYDPEVRIVMIESVRNGVSIGSFCKFLIRNFDLPPIEAAVVINPSDLEKLYGFTSISKFHVKIARLENGNIFKDKKKSVSQITESADNTNTDVLEYRLGVRKRKDSLSLTKIKSMVIDFLKYKETEEVQKLDIMGREGDDSASESIDFIKQRLRDRITIEKERLVSSFQIHDRYDQLTATYKKHKKSLQVYKLKKIV
jgi:hypothetical protein